MTAKHIKKMEEDLQRVNFRKDRMDYVTELLREFDDLDPSALDTIFEYKSGDAKEQLDEFWKERREKERRGVVNIK